MSSQSELRAMMRRQSEKQNLVGKLVNPLIKYEGSNLICKICNKIVGESDALWEPHVVSREHASKLSVLKSKAKGGGSASQASASSMPSEHHTSKGFEEYSSSSASSSSAVTKSSGSLKRGRAEMETAPAPAPPSSSSSNYSASVSFSTLPSSNSSASSSSNSSSSSSSSSSSALPTGFYDDPIADARAHNLDPKVLAAAAMQAELDEFSSFAASVAQDDKKAGEEEDTHYREERSTAAAAENVAFQSRLDVMRLLLGRSRGEGGGLGPGQSGRNSKESSRAVDSSTKRRRVGKHAGGGERLGDGEEGEGEDEVHYSDGEDNVEGVQGAELIGNSFSLLTTPNELAVAISSSELSEMVATRRAAVALHNEERADDEDEELDVEDDHEFWMDWRRKGY